MCIRFLGCVTNAGKFDDLKQQFILSQSWRPEVRDRGIGRLHAFHFWKRNGSLLASGGSWHSWTCGCISPCSNFTSPFLPLLGGHLPWDLGPTMTIQDHLITRSLVISARTLFPNKVTFMFTGGYVLGCYFGVNYRCACVYKPPRWDKEGCAPLKNLTRAVLTHYAQHWIPTILTL